MRTHERLSVVLILAILLVPAARDADAAKTVRDFGAVGDGQTDDTAAIQKAVDSKIGDVVLPRGVYRISGPIVIDLDKVGFTSVRGGGVATIVMAGPGPALRLVGTHEGTADPSSVKPNVYERQRMPIVEGVEIVGGHAESVGIEAVQTMALIVDKVKVRDALHGIHLVTRNRNVIISNCHLYHNRATGLFLDNCNLHQINVVGSHISYNAAGGIVVRGGAVRNLHVGTCDIEANTVNVLIEGGPTSPGATAEVAIVGCTLQHSGGPNSANIRFIGADEKGQRAWGHLTIANNVMSDVLVNIDIQKAREVAIVGNTAWTGYEYNLRVRDSSNVVIGPNVFGRNPKYASTERDDSAIRLEDCEDVTISGLHVHGVRNAPAGLVLANCRRVNVTGCSILDCDNAGVLLDKITHGRVSDCLIRNDLADGGPRSVVADAKPWTPLRVVGGRGNMITDNQTSRPIEADPNAAQASGNMVAP
jgi:hypothetical protein